MTVTGGPTGVTGRASPALVLDVRPAPVLELTYAYFRLADLDGRQTPLPWLRELRDHPPRWLSASMARRGEELGYEALLIACACGYEVDETPDRFLADFPELPPAVVGEFAAAFVQPGGAGGDELLPERSAAIRAALERLAEPTAARHLASTLRWLWEHLRPAWEGTGRSATEAAARALQAATGTGGDLLASLPVHHFVQLEDSVNAIRAQSARGRTLVVPLYFALRGGFRFRVRDQLVIGYGARTEDVYAEQRDGVVALANRLKAFSDPTRLLLLFHVSRLSRFPLTVGDLAKQLGVSQPTASGHLRLLRELGLVTVLRRGNRSYYRLEPEAVRPLLDELERTLLPPMAGHQG